jgi:hypothetical protein
MHDISFLDNLPGSHYEYKVSEKCVASCSSWLLLTLVSIFSCWNEFCPVCRWQWPVDDGRISCRTYLSLTIYQGCIMSIKWVKSVLLVVLAGCYWLSFRFSHVETNSALFVGDSDRLMTVGYPAGHIFPWQSTRVALWVLCEWKVCC